MDRLECKNIYKYSRLSKEMYRPTHNLTVPIFAGIGAGLLADGIAGIVDYLSSRDTIRESFYRAADSIDVTVVNQANSLAEMVTLNPLTCDEIAGGVGFLSGAVCQLIDACRNSRSSQN